jgi:crotonobetainyl-CoA:carnitine CoA-transferase CaiB-like acyl-CoA transferase
VHPCKPGGPNDYVYLLTSRANPEHWTHLLKLIGREDLIGDARYDTPDARLRCEAEVDEIVTGWTRERTKHEAMAQLSSVGVPAGAVLDSMELTNEPSFPQRGILQTMTHGEERPLTVRPALQIPEIRRFRLQCSAARRCRRRLADQHARREFRRRQRRSCLRHGTFQPSRDGSV